MDKYQEFIRSKILREKDCGLTSHGPLNEKLFGFQKEIVKWALKRGLALLGEDCGLGKTIQEHEWLQKTHEYTRKPALLLTPLAVAPQALKEAHRFGYEARIVSDGTQVFNGINICNYQKLDHFDCSVFGSVALDESSILKSFMGKTKQKLCHEFQHTPFKLCASATWAPNDHMEIGNQAEFLGIMPSNEMLARWFINDPAHVGKYRLKGHAEGDFWNWVSSWACCISKPSDIGFQDEGFTLPALNLKEHCVEVDSTSNAGSHLFRDDKLTATTIHSELRRTAATRAERVAALVNDSKEIWTVWCNTDYEALELMKRIPDAVEVAGSMKDEVKEQRLNDFSEGRSRVLVSKPRIAGFGMNFQHCANLAFIGLSYSFEEYYQAVRRSWRFGQSREVNAHIVYAETEGDVISTVKRKQADAITMRTAMVNAMKDTWESENSRKRLLQYDPQMNMELPQWLKSKEICA